MKISALPSNMLPLLAISFISIAVGYKLGNLYPGSLARGLCPNRHVVKEKVEETQEGSDDEEIDEEGIPDGDLAAVKAGILEPCKMVLVVRGDLTLSPNEIASYQATLLCYKSLSKANKSLVQHWERTGQAKIALRGKSESQLLELEAIAKSLNLCARVVRACREPNNYINGSSTGTGSASSQDQVSDMNSLTSTPVPTVLAIGPAPVELVNEVTGKLRLL